MVTRGKIFIISTGDGAVNDGYFYTDNLTPGGNFFNLAQELVINAVPDTSLYAYPLYCEGKRISPHYTALWMTEAGHSILMKTERAAAG